MASEYTSCPILLTLVLTLTNVLDYCARMRVHAEWGD